MKHLQYTTPGDELYEKACRFADKVYKEDLQTETNTPPQTLIVATKNDEVKGCIGLNNTVTSDLFLSDLRYRRTVCDQTEVVRTGEQNIFAVRTLPAGVPLLISAIAAHAQHTGLHNIVYAGINVSCKTVDKLGYEVEILGPTNTLQCSAAQKPKYQCWLNQFKPVSCILSTCNAISIFRQTMSRYGQHTSCDGYLSMLLQSDTVTPKQKAFV